MQKTYLGVIATIGIFSCLALTGTAHAQNNRGQNHMSSQRMSGSSQRMSGSSQRMSGMVSNMDRKFMKMAAIGGLFEVRSSKLALQKSRKDDVRQFAQMMINDHTAVNQELKRTARSKGVSLPTMLDRSHQMTYNQLARLNGSAFDNAYLKAQHQAHVAAVDLLQNEAVAGRDPDAKGFAERHLPHFREHRNIVQNLRNGGSMNMAVGSRMENTINSSHSAGGALPQ